MNEENFIRKEVLETFRQIKVNRQIKDVTNHVQSVIKLLSWYGVTVIHSYVLHPYYIPLN